MLGRLRVGARLAVAFVLLVVLLAATAAVGWRGMSAQQQAQRQIAELSKADAAVKDFLYTVADVTGWQGLVVADAGVVGGVQATAPTSYNRDSELQSKATLYRALDTLNATRLTSSERAVAAPLREIWDGYFRTDDQIVALLRRDTLPARARAMKIINDGASGEAYLRTIGIAEELEAAIAERGRALEARLSAARVWNNVMLAGTLVTAILLALVAGFAVTRSIVRPLRRVVDTLGRLADGDLTAKVNLDSRDELGGLSAAVDRSTFALQLAMQQVLRGADEVDAISTRLSGVAERMSTSADGARVRASDIGAAADNVLDSLRATSADGAASQLDENLTRAAGGSEHIVQSVAQLTWTADATARDAESAKGAADELAEATDGLRTAIAEFKI